MTLVEMIAQSTGTEIEQQGNFWPGHMLLADISNAVMSALRDPPPEVIEAGARAIYVHGENAGYSVPHWNAMGDPSREWWRSIFLASWRAALDAGLSK